MFVSCSQTFQSIAIQKNSILTYCLHEGGTYFRINAITVLQFWRLILLPDNADFAVFSLLADFRDIS